MASQQRMALWAAEDLEEDDLSMPIGSYAQQGQYDDSHVQAPQIDEQTLIAMQQHIAQQAAFSQIPDAVKSVRLSFLSWISDLSYTFSLSSNFTGLFSITISQRSLLPTTLAGTSSQKSSTPRRSGLKRRLSRH